jgi:L-lactate dehydrogenase complex protein LldG
VNPSSREAFLQRIRQAVSAGNRAGAAVPLDDRGPVGYQGAGPDPVARFCEMLTAAGGTAHVVPDRETASARVLQLLQAKAARRVLLGRGAFIDTLSLGDRLRTAGVKVTAVDSLSPATARDPFFAADAGVSGVDYLIAESGTIAVFSRPGEPRSLSLLPPVHIAVAERSQVLPDLFDLFDPKSGHDRIEMSSCLTLITGPSKTGDIELRLVTGVHGPGEVHVVLVVGPPSV